jgi:aminoglycoside 6'-N-acetyltransferase I
MNIRVGNEEDKQNWLSLRKELWPEVESSLHLVEIESMLAKSDKFIVFFALTKKDEMVGFLEASIHEDISDGCEIKNIGYIEGWYVKPEHRRKWIGKALVKAAEYWSLEQGLDEIGSDTGLDIFQSKKAHIALGFKEVDRAILYRKKLSKKT